MVNVWYKVRAMSDPHASAAATVDDEPKSPMWLPALGGALFIAVGLWWAVTPAPPPPAPAPVASASPPATTAAPAPPPPPQAVQVASAQPPMPRAMPSPNGPPPGVPQPLPKIQNRPRP
jgi:hypothetical protein